MHRKKVFILVITAIVFIASITGAYLLGKSSSVKNVEYIAMTTILEEVKFNNKKNVYLLRTMYDEKQNRFWVEFYDTESYTSSLWLGFVVVDSTNYNVVHTETNVQFYSGISPEMAVNSRKSETELHNEYGDFYIRFFIK